MSIITQGARGAHVSELQKLLVQHGYVLDVDGIFGQSTADAVRAFQFKAGLVVDGIVGTQTLNTLRGIEPVNNPKTLSQSDYQAAADALGVDVATIMAVTEVEARKAGFYPEGEPIVLFERHKFYKFLAEHRGADVAQNTFATHPNLCNPKAGGYVGGRAEWFRLQSACAIDRECALLSASYGLFQIMGFNYPYCGFESVDDFGKAISTSEGAQLQAFVAFVSHRENTGMLSSLRKHDWAGFARLYNGVNYAQNDYDSKLSSAYRRYVALYPAVIEAATKTEKPRKTKTA